MKHYVNNNQETNRVNVSANVDERTRMELYVSPFGAAAEVIIHHFCSLLFVLDTIVPPPFSFLAFFLISPFCS